MDLDIRTLFIATAVVVLVNSFVLILAWHYAKSMRVIIGYWSFNELLVGIGTVLTAFRGMIPDFLSMVIGNLCIIISQVALQEGIARYMGKNRYLRTNMLMIVFLQSILFCYFIYVMPSTTYRIIVFSVGSILYSLMSIYTLQKTDTSLDIPVRFLIAIMAFYACIMIFRIVAAVTQGEYGDYLSTGLMQAGGILALLAVTSTKSLCFFWIIAYRLGVEVQKQALTDSLTGLSNRRAMNEFLENLLSVNKNFNIGILLLDVDKFKEINDTFGHLAGDLYLIHLSRIISDELCQGDVVFRYAGDEFVVVVHNADRSVLLQIAERLRRKVENLCIPWQGQEFSTTVSIGLAVGNNQMRNVDDLIRVADEALYCAKGVGRNHVTLY